MKGNGTMALQPQGDLMPIGGDMPMIAGGGAMQRMQSRYATAISVQKPRELSSIENRLNAEADKAGDTFYYGWGGGEDRIEGPSIQLAMAAIRLWGNCVIDMLPIQETHDAWIFTAAFVDLETGFTLTRQFRQSKTWVVHGKFDPARKEDIRFQIGQSKAMRNVVTSAVPRWLLNNAIERAKAGVRASLEEAIEAKGLDEVRSILVKKLGAKGVTEDMVLAKFGRRTLPALTIEDMVVMRGDFDALSSGADTVEYLYPPKEPVGDERKPGESKSEALANRLEKKRQEQSSEVHEPGPSGEESQEAPPFEATAEQKPAGVTADTLKAAIEEATTEEELKDASDALKGALRSKQVTPTEAGKIDRLISAKRKSLAEQG